VQIADIVPQTVEEIQRWKDDPRAVWGIPTGINTLDLKTGGLHRSELTLIAANTNVGKSLLAGQIAFEAARRFASEGSYEWVYVFSNEMLERSYLFREIVGETGIEPQKFRRGEIPDLRAATDVAELLGNLPIDITYDSEGAPIDSVKAVLNEGMVNGRTPGLVIYDFVQNGAASRNDTETEKRFVVGNIGKRLASAARKLDVPIIGVAQLSRKALEGEYPTLAHLAESADLERTADNIWLLHRPAMHDMGLDQGLPQETTLFVAKVRGNGERGVVPLVFHPHRLRFYDAYGGNRL
jgi:replicative DNA helicase